MSKIEYIALILPNSHLEDIFTVLFALMCAIVRKKVTEKGMNSVMLRNRGKKVRGAKIGC